MARNIGKFGKPSVPEIGILLYLEFQLLPLKLAVEHTEGSMCIGHCIVPVFSPGSGMLDLDAMASWICFYFGFNPVLKKKCLDQQNFMYQLCIIIIHTCIPCKIVIIK